MLNTLRATGIVRRLDELGRIVLPKELRDARGITDGTPLEVLTDVVEGQQAIVLRKAGNRHERDVLLEDVFQGALAVHACLLSNTPPVACREQLMEAVEAMVAYESGNPSPIRKRVVAEQKVIKAAREWGEAVAFLQAGAVSNATPEYIRQVRRDAHRAESEAREALLREIAALANLDAPTQSPQEVTPNA